MGITIEFNPSAFKHNVSEADIREAFAHPLFDHVVAGEEYKNLLIGFDTHARLLEILYNVIDDESINVFHADKCRKTWYELVNQEEK